MALNNLQGLIWHKTQPTKSIYETALFVSTSAMFKIIYQSKQMMLTYGHLS